MPKHSTKSRNRLVIYKIVKPNRRKQRKLSDQSDLSVPIGRHRNALADKSFHYVLTLYKANCSVHGDVSGCTDKGTASEMARSHRRTCSGYGIVRTVPC